jgi:DNA-binding XRE family transcriptional regulator
LRVGRRAGLADDFAMICGAQIKAGRILAMLEQEQLAHAAGITETTLRKLEHAGHKPGVLLARCRLSWIP